MIDMTKRKESNLERTFDTLLKQLCPTLSTPEKEFVFARSIGRRWRFDRAWPDVRVAVELEGGVYTHVKKNGTLSAGRHVRFKGFEEDCCKYNTAQGMMWIVLRFTANMLKIDPNRHLKMVEYCVNSFPVSFSEFNAELKENK